MDTVRIAVSGGDAVVELDGDLVVPPDARGTILFAHGSGSSRHSPRNQQVAAGLHRSAFATLLLDLLTPEEDQLDQLTTELRFDIPLLAERLIATVDWIGEHPSAGRLPVGAFGASTGAAAALMTAADRPDQIRAVVSRGGRPDLAMSDLARVNAPTLLIVGGNDPVVLDLNQQAAERLTTHHQLAVVPGATHLFEEAGALAQVTTLAATWFSRWL